MKTGAEISSEHNLVVRWIRWPSSENEFGKTMEKDFWLLRKAKQGLALAVADPELTGGIVCTIWPVNIW